MVLQGTSPQESYFQLLWEHRAEGPAQLLNICLVAAEGKTHTQLLESQKAPNNTCWCNRNHSMAQGIIIFTFKC